MSNTRSSRYSVEALGGFEPVFPVFTGKVATVVSSQFNSRDISLHQVLRTRGRDGFHDRPTSVHTAVRLSS